MPLCRVHTAGWLSLTAAPEWQDYIEKNAAYFRRE
jgi:hypothetical protein